MAQLMWELELEQDVCLIRLRGVIDDSTAGEFDALLERALRPGLHGVVLDFGQVEYMFSSGFGVLMGAQEAYQKQGVELCVAGSPEFIQRIFDMLGLSDVLKVYATTTDAFAAFAGK